MKYKKGDRIGAILSVDDEKKVIELCGYGVFDGYEIPPRDEKKELENWLYEAVVKNKVENPKLKLDDGRIVWGCECWWGDEDTVKRICQDQHFTVVMV